MAPSNPYDQLTCDWSDEERRAGGSPHCCCIGRPRRPCGSLADRFDGDRRRAGGPIGGPRHLGCGCLPTRSGRRGRPRRRRAFRLTVACRARRRRLRRRGVDPRPSPPPPYAERGADAGSDEHRHQELTRPVSRSRNRGGVGAGVRVARRRPPLQEHAQPTHRCRRRDRVRSGRTCRDSSDGVGRNSSGR